MAQGRKAADQLQSLRESPNVLLTLPLASTRRRQGQNRQDIIATALLRTADLQKQNGEHGMNSISFKAPEKSPVQIVGALDFDVRDKGISPRRLPAWTKSQLPEFMDVFVRMPSGVRLAFSTNSTSIEIDALTTRMQTPPQEKGRIAFDLAIDDGTIMSQSYDGGNTIVLNPAVPGEFELERGSAYSVRFDGLSDREKSCELWLPVNVFIELRSLTLDPGSTLNPPPETGRPRWLHYGSSISHCTEAKSPTATWPAVAARLGGTNLQSLGFGGQCHLDQFVARTIRDQPSDLISLKIGINIVNMDSMRERVFTPALHGFLDTIREGKPDTPILVVSPIFCPSAEENPGPTLPGNDGKFRTVPGNEDLRMGCMSLSRMRKLTESVIETRQKEGDGNLHYLSGLALFGPGDGADLPDDLHPNPAGYVRMGERFHKLVFGPGGIWGNTA